VKKIVIKALPHINQRDSNEWADHEVSHVVQEKLVKHILFEFNNIGSLPHKIFKLRLRAIDAIVAVYIFLDAYCLNQDR
jgi:hypothetical protein